MRVWLLVGALLVAGGIFRADAQSGDCQAPSVPDDKPVAGCLAPDYWTDTRTPEQKRGQADADSAPSATIPLPGQAPPAPAAQAPAPQAVPGDAGLPAIGSGAGAPMVVDEGMGRQETTPGDDHARMMRAAGLAAGLRGEGLKPEFSSDLDFLDGYAQGQFQRGMGGR